MFENILYQLLRWNRCIAHTSVIHSVKDPLPMATATAFDIDFLWKYLPFTELKKILRLELLFFILSKAFRRNTKVQRKSFTILLTGFSYFVWHFFFIQRLQRLFFSNKIIHFTSKLWQDDKKPSSNQFLCKIRFYNHFCYQIKN